MTARKTPTDPGTSNYATNEFDYASNPPGVFLSPDDSEIKGIYVSAQLTPEDYPTVAEYGRCVIVTFEAISGVNVQSNSGEVELVPGELYCVWLTSQTLHDAFVENMPTAGEVFGLKSFGTRTSRTRKDSKGDPVGYVLIKMAMPNRPKKVEESLNWSDVALKQKKK